MTEKASLRPQKPELSYTIRVPKEYDSGLMQGLFRRPLNVDSEYARRIARMWRCAAEGGAGKEAGADSI